MSRSFSGVTIENGKPVVNLREVSQMTGYSPQAVFAGIANAGTDGGRNFQSVWRDSALRNRMTEMERQIAALQPQPEQTTPVESFRPIDTSQLYTGQGPIAQQLQPSNSQPMMPSTMQQSAIMPGNMQQAIMQQNLNQLAWQRGQNPLQPPSPMQFNMDTLSPGMTAALGGGMSIPTIPQGLPETPIGMRPVVGQITPRPKTAGQLMEEDLRGRYRGR